LLSDKRRSCESAGELRRRQHTLFIVVAVVDDVGAHHQILQQCRLGIVVSPERLLSGPHVGERSKHEAPRRDHQCARWCSGLMDASLVVCEASF